jgi:hypothetical protein
MTFMPLRQHNISEQTRTQDTHTKMAKEHSINSVKLCTGIIAWKDYFDKYRPDYEQKQQKKEEKHRVGEDMSQWDQQQAKLVSRSIEVSKFPQ